jgi:plastocyanin
MASLLPWAPADRRKLMFIRAIVGCAALSCVVACGDSNAPSSEPVGVLGPSEISGPTIGAGPRSAAQPNASADVKVNMLDACDPDTFNAALGAGTCVRNGGVKFNDFITQLTRNGFVGPWQFAPKVVNAHEGEQFVVLNRGGEVHTFTEVDDFGGGIVPQLNELAHVPNVAPECKSLGAGDFVAPGQTFEEDIEEEGEEKYQCCIHPWMRLTVSVSEAH